MSRQSAAGGAVRGASGAPDGRGPHLCRCTIRQAATTARTREKGPVQPTLPYACFHRHLTVSYTLSICTNYQHQSALTKQSTKNTHLHNAHPAHLLIVPPPALWLSTSALTLPAPACPPFIPSIASTSPTREAVTVLVGIPNAAAQHRQLLGCLKGRSRCTH